MAEYLKGQVLRPEKINYSNNNFLKKLQFQVVGYWYISKKVLNDVIDDDGRDIDEINPHELVQVSQNFFCNLKIKIRCIYF